MSDIANPQNYRDRTTPQILIHAIAIPESKRDTRSVKPPAYRTNPKTPVNTISLPHKSNQRDRTPSQNTKMRSHELHILEIVKTSQEQLNA
ncbi:hypothetical protein [Calothrix sp. 336/3]|uniref:hypothetical protein n=1 Tax=Calothrix sp. 336/3 TaxID=1337936 RepID=UPI0004E29B42|nr:hypothetical protein [Calothrix sp. 336/3]AKG21468.1 hypothetical protein IJ00_09345 [Calothrix sp. 336/3]